MKEIGSEFWLTDLDKIDNNLDFLKLGRDYKLLMSGRTAIDFVLSDFYDDIKIVYMPDYCCKSMMQPFLDNDYNIIFYNFDIQTKQYDINFDVKCSVFFAMNYFGYSDSNMDGYIDKFSNNKVLVIEDITHRFLSDKNYCSKSDYLICSLRKWFPIISGGLAVKVSSEFISNINNYVVDDAFFKIKFDAMKLKRDYINGNKIDKSLFLDMFKKSNDYFLDYKCKKIDDYSINILRHLNVENIKKRRISNSVFIESIIKNNSKIKLLFNIKNGDCPLFVPILIKDRDYVRKQLIEKNIYLPVHWPNDEANNSIYDYELSLINDQRYSIENIKNYIIELINVVGE